MSLGRLLRRFVFAERPPREVAVLRLPADADLAARNAQRQRQARERLGTNWIGAQRVERLDRRYGSR